MTFLLDLLHAVILLACVAACVGALRPGGAVPGRPAAFIVVGLAAIGALEVVEDVVGLSSTWDFVEDYLQIVAPLLWVFLVFASVQHLAQRGLRESRGYFRTLAEASPSLIFRADRNGRSIYANQRWVDLTGRTVEASDGEEWAEGVHAEDRDDALVSWRRAVEAGEPWRHEFRFQHVDGRMRWVVGRAVPIRHGDGPVEGFIGICTDVSDEKDAGSALEESELRYRTLVEHAPEAIVVLDVDQGLMVDANDNACRLFKRERADLLGRSVADLSPRVQPDGVPSDEASVPWIQEALDGGVPVFEWVHLDSEGNPVPVEVRLVRLPASHRTLLRGSLTDISERREEETRRRLMTAELDHRVKNTLASVLSLCDQTILTAGSLEEFREKFAGRLRSLAQTHEALAAAAWTGVNLREVVGLAIAPYVDDARSELVVGGDDVRLPAAAAAPICMALHELMTNAAKYGALSIPDGRLAIEWTREGSQAIVVWRETGVPIEFAPEPGLGTTLIRGLIEHQLGGRVDLRFEDGGFECDLHIPIDPDRFEHVSGVAN